MSPDILSDPDGAFPRHYNRSTFKFAHGLSGHPLLALPRLIELADRLERHDGCYWSNGAAKVTDRWEKGADRRKSLRNTLENIADNDSLVILKFVVHDPIAGPFFRDLLKDIMRLVGPAMIEDVLIGRANILVASPHRITAYHIDSDVNYLLQVAGDKDFAVFDQADRELTTDQELERFFNGDENAARFKPDRQDKATNHDLRAGDGAHVPCMAPHFARNKEQVSVAVSCCFDLTSIQKLGLVYRTNHRLRRIGIRPGSPRDETWTNDAKAFGAKTLAALREMVHPQASTSRQASGWSPRA